MHTRSVLLIASAAVLGASTPAIAQDEHHAPHHDREHHERIEYDRTLGGYDGQWEGEWTDEGTWHGEWTGTYTDADGRIIDAEYRGVWIGHDRFRSEDGHMLHHGEHGWREHHGRRTHGPNLAYSTDQRNQWLAECQYLVNDGSYSHPREEGNGGLLGGILGAVVGGVAGNRIAGDDRLLGTVIGAGLGGLAGAAIGSAIDGDGDGEIDREELYAARYCEAYLQRYEAGGGYAYAQPMMVLPVSQAPAPRRRRSIERVVVEEVIADETPAPVTRRRSIPASQDGKITPIN